MDYWSLWYVLIPACLAVGALIGFTGGVLGIGGGLLAIPLLGLALGMEQQAAQGTALIMVAPAVLLTVRKYNQHDKVNLRAAGAGAVGAIVFTWVGAQIALGADPVFLRRIYAGFVLCIAIFYFHQSASRRRKAAPAGSRRQPEHYHSAWFALIGMIAGMTGGIFGVGGSVLVIPILTTMFRLTQTCAQALALTMMIPSTFVALFTYTAHGRADWLIGVPLALGSVLMVPYGVKLAYALPEPRLKLIFACMLLVIMVLLLVKA
ncbi:sulfite exporter TauE/SafE family protein [Parapusillimonas sp. JC17]|uniref:sulfite exporter TauE/SafE family protein n=1 Tax=Parapusillimonas sp. JC17 TaxID=3445768 RepID=UPI003FA0DAB2